MFEVLFFYDLPEIDGLSTNEKKMSNKKSISYIS